MLPSKSEARTSIVAVGNSVCNVSIMWTRALAPPSSKSSRETIVMTMCLSPKAFADSAILAPSSGSGGKGFLVKSISQKPQRRVQASPKAR
ncbi:Uncharacterised protein [Chlamydia trachomatis]|nr:Uncharacterised protein [Chlamydia trachomatis]